jgi:hypothetical protein
MSAVSSPMVGEIFARHSNRIVVRPANFVGHANRPVPDETTESEVEHG